MSALSLTSPVVAPRRLHLLLLATLAVPAFAQDAENTGEFQTRRREIERRWLEAHNGGDDAGKAAAVAELRALGLRPPESPSDLPPDLLDLPPGGTGATPAGAGDTPGLGAGGGERPPTPTFRVIVEKNDGSSLAGVEYLVGERVQLRARIEPLATGGTAPSVQTWQWSIPGSTIKSYSLDKANEAGLPSVWEGRDGQENLARHLNTIVLTQAALVGADLQSQNISFYWTNEGQNQNVTCRVRAGGAEATGSASVNVRRSTNPARDLYTNTSRFSGNWNPMDEHGMWHSFDGTDRFIFFHREYLRGYNSWRQLFGYPPHVATNDPAAPGSGQFNGGNAKPTYLTVAGGTATSPVHRVTRLGAFATISDLGTDLERQWHNAGHGQEVRKDAANADMADPGIATRCEVFYIWHTRVDNVAVEYEGLRRP